jgi:hypothetical protein
MEGVRVDRRICPRVHAMFDLGSITRVDEMARAKVLEDDDPEDPAR